MSKSEENSAHLTNLKFEFLSAPNCSSKFCKPRREDKKWKTRLLLFEASTCQVKKRLLKNFDSSLRRTLTHDSTSEEEVENKKYGHLHRFQFKRSGSIPWVIRCKSYELFIFSFSVVIICLIHFFELFLKQLCDVKNVNAFLFARNWLQSRFIVLSPLSNFS